MRDRDANNLSDYVDSSFPKQRLIYSTWHQNGITRRKYIYIYNSFEIFFPMIHIFSSAFFLVHLSLSATSFFPSSFFRVAICIHIATVIRLFSSIFRKLHIHYFATSKVSMIREWNNQTSE